MEMARAVVEVHEFQIRRAAEVVCRRKASVPVVDQHAIHERLVPPIGQHEVGAAVRRRMGRSGYFNQTLIASTSIVCTSFRLAEQPAGEVLFASRLCVFDVSKQRAMGVISTTCAAERAAAALKNL